MMATVLERFMLLLSGIIGRADFLSGRQAIENFGRQAACFGTKQQYVAFAEGNFVGAGGAFGGQRENTAAFKCLEAVFEILMYRQFGNS